MASKTPRPLATGDRVKFTRRNGVEGSGRIVRVEDTPRGTWYHVNTAGARAPEDITKQRAAALQRF